MRLKEIIMMAFTTIIVNLFLFRVIDNQEYIINPMKLRWIMGLFTGVIFTKLLIELFRGSY